MNTCTRLVIGVAFFLIGVFGQEIPDADQLKCRLCNNALELGDCTKQAVCDNRTEECYMDQVVTETLNILYRGGCRGRELCKGGTAGAIGKRDEVVSCSQCCSNQDDCNKHLCGLRQDNTNTSQCYFCDSSKSDQASVSKPSDCITLTTCDPDQVCYAHNEYNPGSATTFKYGCQNKYMCKVLMRNVFEFMSRCAGSSSAECQHDSVNCDVCCGDGACNFDDCKQIKARLYNLWVLGKLNNDTLQLIP
ncbi:uncharacterized protein LOC127837589 isoform X3 [Dreissena polymorpha]|uniref:Sodefrin-like factor n=1 Tax=Dreissena polymorpha TaxID=45954 RepID=A0A9D4FLX1_DREPO|nr:uncharacterized protein LOC127837589 isoform X3 [Dreissena polymorpha]KAH3800757.1 hypothetical protein DPMN_154399 [Dreissena polymorpha]